MEKMSKTLKVEIKRYQAPEDLSERSRRLWRGIVPRRAHSPERIELLHQALLALDKADALAEVIQAEGYTKKTKTTGAIHIHPLVKVEKESRAFFLRCWRALNMQWSTMDSFGQHVPDEDAGNYER